MTGYAAPNNTWRLAAWGGAAALLLAPLVAMRFTDEVRWTGFDFAVFAVMLAVPLAGLELALRTTASLAYRAGVAVALGAAFLLTWAALAVGVIGDETNPLNLLVLGVLAVALVGAVIARFRPRGLAWAMVATAIAQALVAGVALTDGPRAALLTLAFAAAWLLSAWLFRKAAA